MIMLFWLKQLQEWSCHQLTYENEGGFHLQVGWRKVKSSVLDILCLRCFVRQASIGTKGWWMCVAEAEGVSGWGHKLNVHCTLNGASTECRERRMG